MPVDQFKPGDVIGFSGRSWYSALINVLSLGFPLWSLSHVGILARASDGRLLLFESTDDSERPCEIAGKLVVGVQAHTLEQVLADYKGRVWRYSLYRPLCPYECRSLTRFLLSCAGRPYDLDGAIRSGGFLFALIESLFRAQDFGRFFCSELVAASLSIIGVFPTTNAGRWSPNRLIRRLRKDGIVHHAERLK